MEKDNKNFETLESYANVLISDVRASSDIANLFEKYTKNLTENKAFENNFFQVIKMASLVADPGIDNSKSIDNFLMGEVLGYAVLQRVKGDSVYEQVYEAMNSLYSHSRVIVNEEVFENPVTVADEYRHRMIGLYINHILDHDLSFDSVPTSEMLLATKLLAEITSSDDQVYDAMRGYTLVRASLVWHERHKLELKKDSLRSTDDSFNETEEFFNILSDVEVDSHLADGRISVQNTIDKINALFETTLLELAADLKNYDDDGYDDLREELVSQIAPQICKTEDLTLTDKVFIDGVNIAMLCDTDGEIMQMIPLGPNVHLKGYLMDYDVNPIPAEDWLKNMHKTMDDTNKKNQGIPFNSFGLVMLLADAEVVDSRSGKVYGIDEKISVYVPISYDSTKIYKIMIPEDDESNYDVYDEDEDEDD